MLLKESKHRKGMCMGGPHLPGKEQNGSGRRVLESLNEHWVNSQRTIYLDRYLQLNYYDQNDAQVLNIEDNVDGILIKKYSKFQAHAFTNKELDSLSRTFNKLLT